MNNSKKAMLLAVGGKLALAPGLASAQGGKDDEMAPVDPIPQLKLNQIAVPFDTFIPPFNDPDLMADGSMFEDELEVYESTGIIFVGEMKEHARMDFVISNIRNDKPVDVYLVMGTELAADEENDLFPGLAPTNFQGPRGNKDPRGGDGHDKPEIDKKPPIPRDTNLSTINRAELEQKLDDLLIQLDAIYTSEAPDEREVDRLNKEIKKIKHDLIRAPVKKDGDWKGKGSKPKPKPNATPAMPVHSGEICIDLASLEVMAAVRVNPTESLIPPSEISIGKSLPSNFTSTIISVNLLKEKLLKFDNQEVFFQAAVVPANDPRPINELLAEGGQVSECDRYVISNIIEADEEYEIDYDDGSKDGGDYSDEYDDSGELIDVEENTNSKF